MIDGRRVVLRLDHGAWLNPETAEFVQEYEEPDGEDSRFGLPLWLRAECCGGQLLWANNEAHLDYLESYIGAALRERPDGPSGLAWRLPAWMKNSKNREEVLRGLARLRASLTN